MPELRSDLTLGDGTSARIAEIAELLGDFPELVALLHRALVENPPVVVRDGGVIADGYDPELDELRDISRNASDYLMDIEVREREATGLSTLKVGYNRVHGYYIEISKSQSVNAPDSYVRRQTLKNAERFITPELKTFEDKALSARSRALARERLLYEQLVDRIREHLAPLQDCATALCDIDVLACFAERAQALDLVCPEFSDDPILDIEAGRHPVVEQVLEQPFIANGVRLDSQRPCCCHRPQHGRQIHLHAADGPDCPLAHVGAFVPARRAQLSPLTAFLPASVPPMTLPAAAPPLWSR